MFVVMNGSMRVYEGDDALAAYEAVVGELDKAGYPATVGRDQWLEWLYGALDNGEDLGPLTCYGRIVIRDLQSA